MRIKTLKVSNFRAITRLTLENLQDVVVIAGPNGCGKSCVFDAIRLLKSSYGGYQPNEWQQWYGEFQISLGQRQDELLSMLQDPAKALSIEAEVILAPEEVEHLRKNAQKLLEQQAWKEVRPDLAAWRHFDSLAIATQLRAHAPEVERRANEAIPQFLKELDQNSHWGQIVIQANAEPRSRVSRVLELLFSMYDPKNVGILDYHGPTRNYAREQVGGVNLSIDTDDQLRQHSLYNWMNKYANLKTQMASGYVRKMLSRTVGGETSERDDLTETLKELFATFFPGKEFLGPRPTKEGGLAFPVVTPAGSSHDINDLSSGEKEVLYGYLRLRNAAPRNSVVLIDEPELHLNPRLLRGLASFYHKHLGKALANQLWLVTHSDTLIREAVGREGFSVYHMQPPASGEQGNQASPVTAQADVERIVIDLVGDLAAYRPGAKIVIFEGGGDNEFDIRMVATLFPDFYARINAISGGYKRRVSDLYEVLEAARKGGHLPGRFYAVTDRDDDPDAEVKDPNKRRWDVYHIENYLLEPKFICRVLADMNVRRTPEDVTGQLADCARETVGLLVRHRLQAMANKRLVQAIDLGTDPKASSISRAIADAALRSSSRIQKLLSETLAPHELEKLEAQFREEADNALAAGNWRQDFRGRDILRRFIGKEGNISYEVFRDLIVSRMRDEGYQPAGMKRVLDEIAADK